MHFGVSTNENDTLCNKMLIYLPIYSILSVGLSNRDEYNSDSSDCRMHYALIDLFTKFTLSDFSLSLVPLPFIIVQINFSVIAHFIHLFFALYDYNFIRFVSLECCFERLNLQLLVIIACLISIQIS